MHTGTSQDDTSCMEFFITYNLASDSRAGSKEGSKKSFSPQPYKVFTLFFSLHYLGFPVRRINNIRLVVAKSPGQFFFASFVRTQS